MEINSFVVKELDFLGLDGTKLLEMWNWLINQVDKDSEIKTLIEIKEEILNIEKTIDNYRNAFKEGKIDRDTLRYHLTECGGNLTALKCVMCENERYD